MYTVLFVYCHSKRSRVHLGFKIVSVDYLHVTNVVYSVEFYIDRVKIQFVPPNYYIYIIIVNHSHFHQYLEMVQIS